MFVSLLAVLALADTTAKPIAYARPNMLIQPAALARLTPGKDVVILDTRISKDYDAGHVPGALRVDVTAWSKAAAAGEGRDRWVARIGALGIDGSVPIVVHDDDRPLAAARVWWILRSWGLKDVRILDGGWKAWQAAGGKVSKDDPTPTPARPALERAADREATREYLLERLKIGKDQIIDSRSRDEHRGAAKTARRNGCIPGAKHLEWTDTLEPKTGKVKSAAELTRLFKEAGIALDQPSTTYCQSGGRAAVMAFVMELLTGKPARNYYRSWSEWGNDPATPIVVPAKKD